jgi:hypothetical protein
VVRNELWRKAGYREGITAGKESTLQSGFDDGYLRFGSPGGKALGQARGQANALLNFWRTNQPELASQAQAIAKALDQLNMDDVCPRDEEAERHFQDEHEGYQREDPSLTNQLDAAFSGALGLKEKPQWADLRSKLDALLALVAS